MNGCSFQHVLLQNLDSFLPKYGKTLFSRGCVLKPTVLGTRDFQNDPPFERSACFYFIISGNFERFQYFNYETNFMENENLYQKPEYRFLVESTKIESTSFSYKTAISESNVKTNRKMSKK